MKVSTFIMVAAMAFASTAEAQTKKISPRGTGGFGAGDNSVVLQELDGRNEGPEQDRSFQRFISGSVSEARVPASHVPTPDGLPVSAANPAFLSLTHLDQAVAEPGRQFSTEPPDQGLAIGGTTECLGGPCIFAAVNSAVGVYTTGGRLLARASMNQFFGLPSAFTPPPDTPPAGPYGPFVSDPRIYFDSQTNRWFVSILEIDRNPATGDLASNSSAVMAVSRGSSPFSGFVLYGIDLTNDGTGDTPKHPGCPCFGDQPLIGADAHAFWVSTNEFPIAGAGFNGAQIYALDKLAMAAGTDANLQYVLQGGPLAEGISYTVQPATIPPGGTYASANNGTQYFLSTLEFFGSLDNRLAMWAATNTASIHGTPAIRIQNEIVGNTIVYGQPPAAQQPNVAVAHICDPDLFMLVGCGLLNGTLLGERFTVHAPLVDSNDDRMQQVVFAAGKLWSTVTTVVKTKNGPTRTAAAWFALTPGWSGTDLTGSFTGGGYVSVDKQSVIFPSIAVNRNGKGAIGFSIVGPGMFPGTGYARVSLPTGATEVKLTSRGAFPDDGFTGYPVFGDRGGRWGDYSAAVADANGDIWVANETIPCQEFSGPGNGCFRTTLANWGTLVAKITP
jgi:hypothetical protein